MVPMQRKVSKEEKIIKRRQRYKEMKKRWRSGRGCGSENIRKKMIRQKWY